MNYLLKEYIKKITEEDIYNFALKEGINLLDHETKIIYMYLKNYWNVFLNEDATFLFEELKEKLEPKTYNKIIDLFNKYKKIPFKRY